MKRCKCSEALKQPYFSNRPHPTPGPMLPMPSSLSNDDESSASDLNVLPGSKRKLREGFETSGLAKKLVFWSVIFFHCFSCKYKNNLGPASPNYLITYSSRLLLRFSLPPVLTWMNLCQVCCQLTLWNDVNAVRLLNNPTSATGRIQHLVQCCLCQVPFQMMMKAAPVT